jgi:hypothetical protein
MAKEIIPAYDHSLHPKQKEISIEYEHYRKLAKWASVARTINESIRLLDAFSEVITLMENTRAENNAPPVPAYATYQEAIMHNIEELTLILPSLDHVSGRCTSERIVETRKGGMNDQQH